MTSRGASAARWAAGAGVLLLLLALGRQLGAELPRFASWVEELGWLGPAVFVLGYALAVVAFVPGAFLTLAGGAIFGVAKGTGLALLAASLGATGAFLIARHGGRRWLEQRLAGDARFRAIDDAVGSQGLKIMILLRLSPAFPFNLLNYALGLTKVRLSDYLLACLGMLPGTLLYATSGKLAGDVAAVAGGAGPQRGLAEWGMLALGLGATLAVTVIVTRIARRALREASQELA